MNRNEFIITSVIQTYCKKMGENVYFEIFFMHMMTLGYVNYMLGCE